MNKAQSERAHFKRRVRERYGLRINRHDYWEIVDKIKSGLSGFLYAQSNTRSVHRVHFKLKDKHNRNRVRCPIHNDYVPLLVVYDNKRGEAITALPHDLTEDDIRSYRGD